jgi:hypothetical protein
MLWPEVSEIVAGISGYGLVSGPEQLIKMDIKSKGKMSLIRRIFFEYIQFHEIGTAFLKVGR